MQMTDVTDYSENRLANFINYIETHGKEEMYKRGDDVDVRQGELSNLVLG